MPLLFPQATRSSSRQAVIAAAQTGRPGQPRFGQISGPNGFKTLPVLKVPLGPSPSDPTTPLELQMEVLAPEGRVCLLSNAKCMQLQLQFQHAVERDVYGMQC